MQENREPIGNNVSIRMYLFLEIPNSTLDGFKNDIIIVNFLLFEEIFDKIFKQQYSRNLF